MKQAWARWVSRFDATEPAYALAVVRILLALTILSCLVNIGVSGVLPLLWHDTAHGGMRDRLVVVVGCRRSGATVNHGLAVTGAVSPSESVTPSSGQLLMVLFVELTTGGTIA
jgi:hypothetical protein